MPIIGQGWELHVVRAGEQQRDDETRTIGKYQVYRDGIPIPNLTGTTAEPGGPGDNAAVDCGLRVEAGTYALATHDGDTYCSIGYVTGTDRSVLRKPALKLEATGFRTDILVHPGHGFLASLGCVNPTSDLATGEAEMAFEDSRHRVVELIRNLELFAGATYPARNGCTIPSATIVIEDTGW